MRLPSFVVNIAVSNRPEMVQRVQYGAPKSSGEFGDRSAVGQSPVIALEFTQIGRQIVNDGLRIVGIDQLNPPFLRRDRRVSPSSWHSAKEPCS